MKLNINYNKNSIKDKTRKEKNMSTVAIVGQLPFDVSDMIPVGPGEQFISVDKVLSKCSPILPHNIHWDNVHHNSWFISIHPQTKSATASPFVNPKTPHLITRESHTSKIKGTILIILNA